MRSPSSLRTAVLALIGLLPAAAVAESDPGDCFDGEIELLEGAECLSFETTNSTAAAVQAPGVRLDGVNTCDVSCTITLTNVDYEPNDDPVQPEDDELFRWDAIEAAAGEAFSLEVLVDNYRRLTDGQTATVEWNVVCGAGTSEVVDDTMQTRVDYTITRCDSGGGSDGCSAAPAHAPPMWSLALVAMLAARRVRTRRSRAAARGPASNQR